MNEKASNPVLTQLSTIHALASGLYQGFETVGEMTSRGDFGLGTFEDLHGELMLLEGEAFRFTAEGRLEPCSKEARVAFYAVSQGLDPGEASLESGACFEATRNYLDARLPTLNVAYAVRLDGRFRTIKTRSFPAQKEPYPPLIEVPQLRFEFHDLEGTLLGFRCPSYLSSVNVAGYHLHLLDAERQVGGHVLDFELDEARFSIAPRPDYRLVLPFEHPAFRRIGDLQRPAHEIDEIEG